MVLGKRRIRLAIASVMVMAVAGAVLALSFHHPVSRSKKIASVLVPIEGKVTRLLVRDGDAVQQGQLLAELDTSGYEADLKKAEIELQQIQGQAQSAIMPMEALPGMNGFLPPSLPQVEYVKVAVPAKLPPQPQPPAAKSAPAISQPPVADKFQSATDAQKKARTALDGKTQELAKATAAVADAQKARDALRPKITQAEADATQADKKAAEAPELLANGAISQKRADEIAAEKETTKKALDDLKGQVTSAEKALADAQATQKAAQDALAKATGDLKAADDLLAKAGSEPAKTPPPAKPQMTAPVKPAVQPQPTQMRIVMKKKPMVVRQEEAPPIPLKVFVDEKTMQSSQQRIAELQKLIEQLKQEIAQNKILAPASGRVHIVTDGAIEIVRAA